LPSSSLGSSFILEASKVMLACPVSTDSAKSLPTGYQTTCTGDLRRAN
jgi:hypothetical protein